MNNKDSMMLTKKTIREQIVEILRARIIGGEIKPGDHIIEVELAEEFHVSRGPIREALRQLEEEGLVTYQSHKGCVVRTMTYEELQEIYLLRSTLETLAIRVCDGKLSPETEERMEEILKAMGEKAKEKDLYQSITWDEEFHTCIVQNAGCERIYKSWKSLAGASAAVYYTMGKKELVPFDVVKRNHEKILEAFHKGDVEYVCEKIEKHYMVVPSTLKKMQHAKEQLQMA